MNHFQLLVGGFRARAEEISARAETMLDADARKKMRGIAAGYEKLAARVEQAVQTFAYRRAGLVETKP